MQEWEETYDDLVPHCEHPFAELDDKTAECDAIQIQLERADIYLDLVQVLVQVLSGSGQNLNQNLNRSKPEPKPEPKAEPTPEPKSKINEEVSNANS